MLRDFREKVNLKLYGAKKYVFNILRVLHILVAFSMVGVLTIYYGFEQTEKSELFLSSIIQYSFLFYIFRFIVKFVFDFNPIAFFTSNKTETFLILFLIVEGISYNFTGGLIISRFFSWLGFKGFMDFSNIIIQLFFIFYVILELFKKRNFRQAFKLHPGLVFTLSILIIVLMGTGMLMLPEMTTLNENINFTDALFMSISSVSVTGLTTFDVPEILTFKGQLVVLVLIQIGAFNTIAFAALYLLLAKFGIGLKQHSVLEDFMNKDSFSDTEGMFIKILKWVLGIELLGFILIFIFIEPTGMFAETGDRAFHSLFHAVSGFNNAGISTVPDGLMNPLLIDNYLLHLVILVLFFLGGFGMVLLFDIFEIKKLRERMRYPWKTYHFGTKITLYSTLFLLLLGAFIFYIFESDKALSGMSGMQVLVISFFESMTTRSAGFSLVDTGALSLPVLIFFLFLMFVGAGSGSSGGGIRVSTFAVMLASVYSTIRGSSQIHIFKRRISNDLVMRAYSIFIFYVVGNLVGIFVLSITEMDKLESGAFSLMDIVFEHVSAASTVGLSTGITGELSIAGKYVLIVAMFIGRVGTLTLAYLFGKKILSNNYKYPLGHTMIG